MHIAVLGGGLTGLSSAFYLSRRFPEALVTVVEKQNRLGGWVRSKRIQLHNNDPPDLTVEAGPRTLRPTSKAVLELINLLNLQPVLATTSRASPAAKSRFLYMPSLQPGLVSIPSSPLAFLKSPLRNIILPAFLREPLRGPNRRETASMNDDDGKSYDEPFDTFLSRRFGPNVARILGSSLCHGVYAADAQELSTRAAFPSLYDLEERGRGSVVIGVFKQMLGMRHRGEAEKRSRGEEYILGDVEALMRGVAVYSFHGGIQTFSDALVKALVAQSNVELFRGEEVRRIEMREDQESSLFVRTSQRSLEPSHIVSALPLPLLHSILSESSPSSYAQLLPHLTANSTSSVTVLSLIFNAPPHTIHPPGFGYLVPRPPGGYDHLSSSPSPRSVDSNAHELGVLGTVFDSCSLPVLSADKSEQYTKLTVMLGGPYLRSPSTTPVTMSDNDNDAVLIQRVLAHLTDAFQRPLPEPVASRVWHHVDCIPTLRVGHVERMKELWSVLQEKEGKGAWRGRMEVIGAGVGGVSVGDCVEAGRRVGAHW